MLEYRRHKTPGDFGKRQRLVVYFKEGCACNGCFPIPCNQVRGRAISHGTFPKPIPVMALKAAPGDDAIPNFGFYFVDTIENLHIYFSHAYSCALPFYMSKLKTNV